jgi:uncharacterized membrane protein
MGAYVGKRPDSANDGELTASAASAPSADSRGPSGTGRRAEPAVEENVQTIKAWERAVLLARSKAEQVGDWIACTAASGPVLLLHVVWFTSWVIANVGLIPGVEPFDRFPFPFLTMTVSLEAIFLEVTWICKSICSPNAR